MEEEAMIAFIGFIRRVNEKAAAAEGRRSAVPPRETIEANETFIHHVARV